MDISCSCLVRLDQPKATIDPALRRGTLPTARSDALLVLRCDYKDIYTNTR